MYEAEFGMEVSDKKDDLKTLRIRCRNKNIFTPIPLFHERHALKFASLDKSIAYPVDPWFQLGGFPLTVGLVLALTAALLHIFIA